MFNWLFSRWRNKPMATGGAVAVGKLYPVNPEAKYEPFCPNCGARIYRNENPSVPRINITMPVVRFAGTNLDKEELLKHIQEAFDGR